jgi:hypothetical protein
MSKLSSLVQATSDPGVLIYIWIHLGQGVTPDACFYDSVGVIRQQVRLRLIQLWQQQVQQTVRRQMELTARRQMELTTQRQMELTTLRWQLQVTQQQQMEKLTNFQLMRFQRLQKELMEDRVVELMLDQQERQVATLLFKQSNLERFVVKLGEEKPEFLRQQLNSRDPLARLLTLRMIGQRRLHLEPDLIPCLGDPRPDLRETAHQTLMRIARGTDFGPKLGVSRKGLDRSIDKWNTWLALQQDASKTPLAKVAAVAGTKPMQFLAENSDRELHTLHPEAARLCKELVQAKGSEQQSILARMRDERGIDHTDALAVAILKLPQPLRLDAEEALAQRLTRMTTATLRDKLQDDNEEVRRAAAFACGRKLAKELIPDLVQLLDDPEPDVIQAARVALTELTGEDFGPSTDADARGRADTVAAWRKWCKENAQPTK